MFTSSQPSSSWRHHVQDQEEDLVRELMQADDVDAVLARVEGDHFRHLSPVIRRLSAFDGPPQPKQLQQQQPPPPPKPASKPSPATPSYEGQRRNHPPLPPPPPSPPATEPTNTRPYGASRISPGHVNSRDGQAAGAPPSFGPYASSHHPSSAPPSTFPRSRYDNGVPVANPAAAPVEAAGDFSPVARPPRPTTYLDQDPLDAYRRPATTPAEGAPNDATVAPATGMTNNNTREFYDPAAELRYHDIMDSWLKPDRELPLNIWHDSPTSTAQPNNPFTTTRPPTYAAPETSFLVRDGIPLSPAPGSQWASSDGQYHSGENKGRYTSAYGSNNSNSEFQCPPRITTTTTTGLAPPLPSGSRGRADVGELENASQSRIARQLQLLRNYRELAELCSNTKDPSVDLFRSLPAEELARLQAEQLQNLPQREQSPITVNNNYYFDGTAGGSRRGSGGRGGHSPGRSGRSRLGNGDATGTFSKMDASPTVAEGASRAVTATLAAAETRGNSPSVSEVFTVDSHQGLTSHQPSGASSSQPPRPPLLPSPRIVPLQSPQPSSGPDSPVATPPLLQRGGNGGGTLPPPPPPLAPPSPSRSYRARSHRSRHHDLHYTPTATTEEAGSSYDDEEDENAVDEDYAGDFIDNATDDDDNLNGEDYDDTANAPRPPPPRIIEREQHRRVPNNNGNDGDYSTSKAQPPLSPTSHQQQLQQQQQQHGGHPEVYMANDISAGATVASLPPNALTFGASPSSMGGGGGVAGSDVGRRSVSSAINVLSGDHELRTNAQLGANGMVDSRRGSMPQSSHSPQQQQQSQRNITAYNGNNATPLPSFPQQQQQQRRSLSAGSTPHHHRRDGGALTDPGMGSFSDPFSLPDSQRDNATSRTISGGRRRGNSTPEKRYSGTSNGSNRGHFGNSNSGNHNNDVDNGRSSNNNYQNSSGVGVGNSRRQSNYRGGGGNRDYNNNENGHRNNYNSDYLNGDLGPSSSDNDVSASEGDTPNNPQLQTHNPRSSAMRRWRHDQRQQQQQQRNPRDGNENNIGRASRTLTNASGGRGRRQDGWDEDGTVHTPRARSLSTCQRTNNRNGRLHRPQVGAGGEPQSRQHGERRRRGRGNDRNHHKDPWPPYYDDDGVEVNSASTYSYSYTTSSDITDYVAGSYFSPVKDQSYMRGRGGENNNGTVGSVSGGRSPTRGRGRGSGSPTNNLCHTNPQQNQRQMQMRQQQQQRQQPAHYTGGVYPPHDSPQQGRSRSGAVMTPTTSDARGVGSSCGGGGSKMNNNVNKAAGRGAGGRGSPLFPYYNSEATYGKDRGEGLGVGAAASTAVIGNSTSVSRRGPVSLTSGEQGGLSVNPYGSAAPLQQTQLPQGDYPATVGGGNRTRNSNISNNKPTRGPRTASTGPAARTTNSLGRVASVAAASGGASPANGFVQLPNGFTVPASSPAGRQHRQMLQQQQTQGAYPTGMATTQQQPFGCTPSTGVYPATVASVSRQRPEVSPTTSPARGAQASSPSVAASNVNRGGSTSPGAGGSSVHIHPGLLYGSLLPKARPKTALVVEDDNRGRERSVNPHGDPTHEPFMDPGSVCPVQPATSTAVQSPPRNVFIPPRVIMDTFPLTGAINGATAEGVQPLAWKSGGSGCVVGRSGHIPPAPAAKLSSHYVAPNSQQRRTGVASGVASSVSGPGFTSGIGMQQQQQYQGQPVVSILQQQQQHFNPLRQPATGRRDSVYSLQSEVSSRALQQQHPAIRTGANSSQQRYVPLQKPLEPARGSGGVSYVGSRSPGVMDPYTPRGRVQAERNANLQRFGIAPVQG